MAVEIEEEIAAGAFEAKRRIAHQRSAARAREFQTETRYGKPRAKCEAGRVTEDVKGDAGIGRGNVRVFQPETKTHGTERKVMRASQVHSQPGSVAHKLELEFVYDKLRGA